MSIGPSVRFVRLSASMYKKLIRGTCSFFHSILCNRNSLDGLVHSFRYTFVYEKLIGWTFKFFSDLKKKKFIFVSVFVWQELISWTCTFFRIWKRSIFFFILLLFLHLCNRNSLAGLVNFFGFERIKNSVFLFLFLHLCNRNSLAGLVHLFRFWQRKVHLSFSCLFLHLCNRNSLAELVNFFSDFEKKIIVPFFCCFYIERWLIAWTFEHVHAFSF